MKKLLFILHTSPPMHGAAKVGDFIKSSKKINQNFTTKYIQISSSSSLQDIGKVSIRKLLRNLTIIFKVFWSLCFFRPQILYFTVSVSGIAFYRDFLISILIKLFSKISKTKIYYHYHTKGVDAFTAHSFFKTFLVKFFLNNVNVILLSPELGKDLARFPCVNKVFFLPNGVADNFTSNIEFRQYLYKKLQQQQDNINILFLSNMLREKGFMDVLEFANRYRDISTVDMNFHFAGAWGSEEIKNEFVEYVKTHNLENRVFFHGFIEGEKKDRLFRTSHFLFFPTKNEAFGLVVPEAFSYGIPAVTSGQGSLPFIVSPTTGLIIDDFSELDSVFTNLLDKFLNLETSLKCRARYLDLFEESKFENNFLMILNDT